MRGLPAFLVVLSMVSVWGCRPQETRNVTLLVTPEVAATGLHTVLAASFERQTSRKVDVRVLTAEQIMAAAAEANGGAAMYSDEPLDTALRRGNLVSLRTVIGWEDYYILGPPRDPANVGQAKTATEAFRRIALEKRTFCSPADVSMTKAVENEIWSAAQIDPRENRRYRPCRGDEIDVLLTSANLAAYTIASRAASDAKPQKNLKVLLREAPMLHDPYVVALLRAKSTRRGRSSEWFVQWVMSYRGREALRNLRGPGLPKLYPPEAH